MADLSSVVSFFALGEEAPGRGGRQVFGLRGRGRSDFPAMGVICTVDKVDVEGRGSAGMDDCSWSGIILSFGIQCGHVFASSELSGTSSISLGLV